MRRDVDKSLPFLSFSALLLSFGILFLGCRVLSPRFLTLITGHLVAENNKIIRCFYKEWLHRVVKVGLDFRPIRLNQQYANPITIIRVPTFSD